MQMSNVYERCFEEYTQILQNDLAFKNVKRLTDNFDIGVIREAKENFVNFLLRYPNMLSYAFNMLFICGIKFHFKYFVRNVSIKTR